MIEQKRKIFEDTLTDSYDHEKFVVFLKELLHNVQLKAPNAKINPYNTFSSAISHYYYIGQYIGSDDKRVALFSVCLKKEDNIQNARSMQRNFVKTLLETSGCAGALVAFYTAEEPAKWRLSLVRMDYEFSQGKISTSLTPAKRYSYLVGKGEPCHTAMDRLYPIFMTDDARPTLDELEEAFSVEAVTKEFFDRYRDKYLDIKLYLDDNADFVRESKSRGFTSEQFAKKLLGQIVFLYFIQKKGWLGVRAIPQKLTASEFKSAFYQPGWRHKEIMQTVFKQNNDGSYTRDTNALLALSEDDETELAKQFKGDPWGTGPKDFMRQIFKECMNAGNNYFDDYLEPFFYTGLNRNRGENAFFPPLHRRVPFLSGGLFEEMQGYDWQHNEFRIPNEMFSNIDEKGRDADGILDVFDRFNFTMAEDEPMEREVAIDPEMLGKVFENLLDVKDRKSKGAFYTPREIVHYMCQESLINYLAGKTGIADEDIRKFILYGEYFRDTDTQKTLRVQDEKTGKFHYEFDRNKEMEIPASILSYKDNINRLQELDTLLENVKIADPAVGSGAFPLGMLNEIVKARQTITAYMLLDMVGERRWKYRSDRSPYWLKRAAIKNSIFACDIEPSAVDITRLRLWLSLVIDNQIGKQDDEEMGYSTKPIPLPNLDSNIICGNSLMDEFEGVKLLTENAVLGNQSDKSQYTLYDQTLGYMIHDLINLQSKLYDEKDNNEKESMKQQIQSIYDQIILEQLKGNPELIDKYYQATQLPSKPFVLWQLYFPKVFRDNDGFDIVLGNPPYISAPAQLKDPELAKNRRCLIESNRYKTLNSKWDLYIPFMELGVQLLRPNGSFTMIVPYALTHEIYGKKLRQMFMNETNLKEIVDLSDVKVFEATVINCIPFAVKELPEDTLLVSKFQNGQIKKQFRLSYSQIVKDSKSFVWVLSNDKSDTLKANLKVLGDYCYISVGMVLNADEKKAQGEFKKEDLISPVQDNLHPKKYIEGKDIDKYLINRYRYLEWGTHRSPNELRRPTFEELYMFPKLLCNRIGELKVSIDEDGGLFHNDSIFACVPWWELKDVNNKSISSSVKKFSKFKRQDMEILSQQINLYYLLAVMNSSRAGRILDEIRSGGYNIYPDHIRNIPIPSASVELQKKIEFQVIELLHLKKQMGNNKEVIELEQIIDKEIEELYSFEEMI